MDAITCALAQAEPDMNRYDQANLKNRQIYHEAGLEADKIAQEKGLDKPVRDRVFNRLAVHKQLIHDLRPAAERWNDAQLPLAVDDSRVKAADAMVALEVKNRAKTANDASSAVPHPSQAANSAARGQDDANPNVSGYRPRGKRAGGDTGPDTDGKSKDGGHSAAGAAVPAAGAAFMKGMGGVGRIAAPVAIAVVVAECGHIYYLHSKDEIDAPEAKRRYVVAGAGGAGGLLGAMLAGAAAGSIVPGPGTVIGGIVGGLVAMVGSRALAKKMMS